MLTCKRKPQSQVFRHAAETDDTFPRILTDTVSVKTDGDLDAGSAHDVLLFFVFKKLQHIRMLPIVMDGIVADVHLPEDPAFPHLHEIRIRIFPARMNKAEHIGMRHPELTAASLCKCKQIAVRT